MKTKSIYQGIALLAVALTTAACQNELNEKSTEPKPSEKINMTIRATQGTGPQTRTDYEDKLGVADINKIVVTWEGGTADNATVENILVCGYSDDASGFDKSETMTSKPETLSDDRLSITFEGDVTPADNYLAIYPASDLRGGISFDNQEQNCSTGQEMAHLKKYDIMTGQPVDGSTNNFKFEHQASMLRFDLTLLTKESINKITLTTTKMLSTGMSAILMGNDILFDGYGDVNSISLAIKNHTSSTTLKAYMMTAPCDLSNDNLTITVNTASNSTYTGILTTGDNTVLEAGKCYTLTPTLAVTPEINIPALEEGQLEEALDKITSSNPAQTKLVLAGTVSDADIAYLADFLGEANAQYITTLDLSDLTGITEVKGLAACTKIKKVVLPDDATAIGDNAFSGCTALTTVIQNETTAGVGTRASMPKRVRTVGKEAFKNCTSMTEMFLHDGITSVGNNAFEGCSAMTALVFEGTQPVGNGTNDIKLGTDIVKGSDKVSILLPKITEAATATTYKKALGKNTFYKYEGPDYDTDDIFNKVASINYTMLPNDPGATAPGLPGGEVLGK